MDFLRSMRVGDLLGMSIGFFDPMNGGKTEGLVSELRRASYYNFNAVAYNSALNTRERDAIVVDGEKPFPARTVLSVDEIKDDLEKRIHANRSLTFPHDQRGKGITVEGLPQRAGYPLRVVGIDEANLFTLTPDDAQKMIDFLAWSREQGLAVYLSGLKHDFRHLPFGYIHSVLPYVDIQISKKPACMAIRDTGEDCNNTANHTQRVWSSEFAREQGLEQYLTLPFNFVDKDGTHFFNRYVPAPFFDKTVQIEGARSGQIKYLPVCNDCAQVPFKAETFEVYNALVRGDATFGLLGQPDLTTAITKFLLEEQWVERQDSGVLVPVPFYRHQVGGYARREKD